MRTELENTDFQPSTASEQELKFGDTCFVPVLGKISTAMRWHRLEILTTQWCEADGSRLQFLSGWSTRPVLKFGGFFMFFFGAVIYLLMQCRFDLYIAYRGMVGSQLKKSLLMQRYFSP